MIFIAALAFVLAAIRAAGWLGGLDEWFWAFLGFAAWVLASQLPLITIGRRNQ